MAKGKSLLWICLPIGALLLGILIISCTKPLESRTPTEPTQEARLVVAEHQFTPQEIKVKALRRVKLRITSFDREYSVWAPDLGIERQRVPARGTLQLDFTPLSFGTYTLRSSGTGSSTAESSAQIIVSVCPPEAEIPNPIPSSAESLRLGEQVYRQSCQSCHGAEGRGDGPNAKEASLKPIDLTQPFMAKVTAGEKFWIISNGWYSMPPFKGTLSEETRWHLVNYLDSLIKP